METLMRVLSSLLFLVFLLLVKESSSQLHFYTNQYKAPKYKTKIETTDNNEIRGYLISVDSTQLVMAGYYHIESLNHVFNRIDTFLLDDIGVIKIRENKIVGKGVKKGVLVFLPLGLTYGILNMLLMNTDNTINSILTSLAVTIVFTSPGVIVGGLIYPLFKRRKSSGLKLKDPRELFWIQKYTYLYQNALPTPTTHLN
jgi:hypothetical protein